MQAKAYPTTGMALQHIRRSDCDVPGFVISTVVAATGCGNRPVERRLLRVTG